MSSEIDPKDPNLATAFALNIAAMAVQIQNIDAHIVSHHGMLDDETRLKMAESLDRVALACETLRVDLVVERKPQEWGPCPRCGGTYRFETVGPCGMDAFKVTKIVCTDCNFTVNWHDDPNGSAPHAWQHVAAVAAHEKFKKQLKDERNLKR